MPTYKHVCEYCQRGFTSSRVSAITCGTRCRGARAGSRNLKGTSEDRFWSRVIRSEPDECWLWGGKVNDAGYGIFNDQSNAIRAHRFSWQLEFGEIADGLKIRHRCDNPPCVNPRHLEPGTHKQNMEDMVQRGRGRSGKSRCGNGHDLTLPGSFRLLRHRGYIERVCVECNKARQARYQAKKLTPGLS